MDESGQSAAPGGSEREFILARALSSVGELNTALELWLRDRCVPESTLRAIQVCCDEILANAVHHVGDVPGSVQVLVRIDADRLQVRFKYRARFFDPASFARPNPNTPVSLRQLGGLGLHLLQTLTDRIDHQYRDGYQIVAFEKRFAR